MKQVYKCEYCSFIGTAAEVTEHEKTCIYNPDVKCCANCRWAHYEGYFTSSGFNNNVPNLVCKYREFIENSKSWEIDENGYGHGSICSISDPIQESPCEHYERGTPSRVIPL